VWLRLTVCGRICRNDASKLDLKTADEVFAILEKYYPRQQIKPVTQFFVEGLFGQIDQSK
jgi:hypothetical protein